MNTRLLALLLSACSASLAGAASPDTLSARASVSAPDLSAEQIVARNAAARGGLEAWRKIRTMVWVGRIEGMDSNLSRTPFVLEQKRPNKTRFEMKTQHQMGMRIYDGSQGWKLRPARGAAPGLQPFTREEMNYAHDAQGIDGPLLDDAAKGITVGLDGVDEVEGRQAYRLNVILPSGAIEHVWVDAQTFLDTKIERVSRNTLGQPNTVSMYYRDYRSVEGLKIPFMIETGTDKSADKMVIERVVLNPPMDDRIFARPDLPRRHNDVGFASAGPPFAQRSSLWPAQSLNRVVVSQPAPVATP